MITSGNATIHVANMNAAIEFYTRVFGMELTHRLGSSWALLRGGASYWCDDTGAGLVVGLRGPSEGAPDPGANGSVMFGLETYRPIEEVAAVMRREGVRLSDEIIRSDIGNFVSIEDMDGNGIYLWEIVPEKLDPEGKDSRDTTMPEGRAFRGGHVNIYVSDMNRAVTFYNEVLGLRLTNRFDNHWATLEAGHDLVIGLHPASPRYPSPGTPGAIMLALTVNESLQKVVSRLARRGVRVNGAPRTTPLAHVVTLDDPDGNRIEFQEVIAQSREASHTSDMSRPFDGAQGRPESVEGRAPLPEPRVPVISKKN